MNSRAITEDDFERVAALLREDEERLLGRESRVGANDLREWLSRTDLAEDSWLYEDDGEVVAAGWTDLAPGNEVAIGIGVVGERWQGRGLGAQLLQRSEQRARDRRAARMHAIALGADRAASELIASYGFTEIRARN